MLDMISIDRAFYQKLQERSLWLECLEQAGVDNWEGFSEAVNIRLRVLGPDTEIGAEKVELRQPAAPTAVDPTAPPG